MAVSIRPFEDVTTRAIAQYLKDHLNAAYLALDPAPDYAVGSAEDPVVVGIREHNTFLNVAGDFPILMVYRTGSSQPFLTASNAVAAYYLPSVAVTDRIPGIFRWVEVQIARALEDLRPYYEKVGNPQILLHDLANIRSEHAFFATDNGIFPVLRIFFSFSEIGA